MSEQKKISGNTFDDYNFIIIIFIAFIGFSIKLLFEKTSLKDSNVKTATGSLVGYTLLLISIVSLLFLQTALGTNEQLISENLSESIFKYLPTIAMLIITLWMLAINISYKDTINEGNLTGEYRSASSISNILQAIQIGILFVIHGTPDRKEGGDNSNVEEFQQDIKKHLKSITFLLTILNILFIGVININLEFFHTDD